MKDSGHELINSTMAELAFMLVFVFALYAAVGNAREPDNPNAAARVLAAEKSETSCLYVPFDPTDTGKAKSGGFVNDGASTKQSINTAPSKDDPNRPAKRSLLQFYWQAMEDDENPGTVVKESGTEMVFLHYNLDKRPNPDDNKKPFLFLNAEAEAAVLYAELELNKYLFNFLNNRSISYVNEPRIPHFKKGKLIRFENFRNVKRFVHFLIEMDSNIQDNYNCRFFYDFFNFPVEGFENSPRPDDNFSTSDVVIAGSYRDLFDKLIKANSDRISGAELHPPLKNTHKDYPIYQDDTF